MHAFFAVTVFETCAILMPHFFIPNIVSQEINQAFELLIQLGEEVSLLNPAVFLGVLPVVADVPSYMFVSTRIAHEYRNLLEGMLVLAHETYFPERVVLNWDESMFEPFSLTKALKNSFNLSTFVVILLRKIGANDITLQMMASRALFPIFFVTVLLYLVMCMSVPAASVILLVMLVLFVPKTFAAAVMEYFGLWEAEAPVRVEQMFDEEPYVMEESSEEYSSSSEEPSEESSDHIPPEMLEFIMLDDESDGESANSQELEACFGDVVHMSDDDGDDSDDSSSEYTHAKVFHDHGVNHSVSADEKELAVSKMTANNVKPSHPVLRPSLFKKAVHTVIKQNRETDVQQKSDVDHTDNPHNSLLSTLIKVHSTRQGNNDSNLPALGTASVVPSSSPHQNPVTKPVLNKEHQNVSLTTATTIDHNLAPPTFTRPRTYKEMVSTVILFLLLVKNLLFIEICSLIHLKLLRIRSRSNLLLPLEALHCEDRLIGIKFTQL